MMIRVSILSCTAKKRQSAAVVQFFNIKLKGRARSESKTGYV